MKRNIVSICFLLFCCLSLHAQVGIINLTPDASAALQVTPPANDKGVLLPRLNEDQVAAIASPATGLLLFDYSNNVYKYFNGTEWLQIGTTSQTNNPAGIVIKDAGDIYYNTATFDMNYYNGTAWRKFVKTGTAL